MLNVGCIAPDFELQNQDGKSIKLSDYIGKKVVLYFYPKDNTSGCSKQACGFSELYPSFLEKEAVVFGVSKDSVTSHKKFAEKFNLKFDILSDESLNVIKQYDVWKEKNMYGKKVWGVVRTTYLIDENGIIQKAMEKVNVNTNPSDMLETI